MDLTDLETFGETTTKTSGMKKTQNEEGGGLKSKQDTSFPHLNATKGTIEHPERTRSTSQVEMNSSLTNTDTPPMEPLQPVVSETTVPKTELLRQDSAQDRDEEQAFTGDSEDEKLVIDDSASPPAKQQNPQPAASSAGPPAAPAPETTPVNTDSSSPHKGTRSCRQSKRAKVSGDQLGEILRMQTAMFKPSRDTPTATKSSTRSVPPSVPPHPTPLVKPCVTSYLERHQNKDGETGAPLHKSEVVTINATEHKS